MSPLRLSDLLSSLRNITVEYIREVRIARFIHIILEGTSRRPLYLQTLVFKDCLRNRRPLVSRLPNETDPKTTTRVLPGVPLTFLPAVPVLRWRKE